MDQQENKFTHLHCHSTYSFLDGYGLPRQYVDKLKSNNQTAMGLTDHGSTWGHIPFYFELKDKGIKPILGCEMYYSSSDITTIKERSSNHITILAKNNIGFNNLNKAQSWANITGFYYKPKVDTKRLTEYGSGLIVLSGCVGSGFPIKNINDPDKVLTWMSGMKDIFGENFYVEISPINYNPDQIMQIIPLADKLKIPIVMTGDVHFPKEEDHIAEDTMLCIGTKQYYKSQSRLKIMEELYLWDNKESYKKAKDFFGNRADEFINNANIVAEKCNVELTQSKPLHYFKNDANKKKAITLFNGSIQQGIDQLQIPDSYLDRLKFEVDIITKKGFVNYFLIIADLIKWAKKSMTVGPGRGSAAGSLVSYILGITEVDPIKHGLLFERFIDISRSDLPDIDIDFPHTERQKIIDYLVNKYGENNVSLLGTLSYFKGKNSIWDVGRIFNIPYATSKKLANQIEASDLAGQSFSHSLKKSETMREIVADHKEYNLVNDIEGQIRQSSIHASAVVISREELFNFGSFKVVDENRVLCIDKPATSKINLLKIDVLSLKQLSIIDNILKLIGKTNQYIYDIDLEDPKVYETLNSGKDQGIFQFDGDALRPITAVSQPTNFESFQEISALARPGALMSGTTNEFLKRKAKNSKSYITPLMEPITKNTYGLIIYQEQIMKVLSQIGKVPMKDVNKIRKRMADASLDLDDSKKETINKYFKQFKKGCLENELNEDQIKELWKTVLDFSSYAFNKSHSVSYGYISYWTLYLKTYHPNEFFISNLKYEKDDLRIKKFLKEWVIKYCKGLVILDPDKSQIGFSIEENTIYGGYSNVKSIGEKAANKIINSRAGDLKTFKKDIGKKNFETLESLNAIPKFKTVQQDLFGDNWIPPEGKKTNIPLSLVPWANLIPIDKEKFGKYYSSKGFKEIADLKSNVKDARIIGCIYECTEYTNNYKLIIEDNTGIITGSLYMTSTTLKAVDLQPGTIVAIEGNKFGYKISIKKIKVERK